MVRTLAHDELPRVVLHHLGEDDVGVAPRHGLELRRRHPAGPAPRGGEVDDGQLPAPDLMSGWWVGGWVSIVCEKEAERAAAAAAGMEHHHPSSRFPTAINASTHHLPEFRLRGDLLHHCPAVLLLVCVRGGAA